MSPFTINFTTSVPDKKRPEITFTSPEDEQKDVGHDADILIRFSEPVDRPKLRSGIHFDPKVDLSSDQWLLYWATGEHEEVTISPPVGIKPFEMNKEYTMYLLKTDRKKAADSPLAWLYFFLIDYIIISPILLTVIQLF